MRDSFIFYDSMIAYVLQKGKMIIHWQTGLWLVPTDLLRSTPICPTCFIIYLDRRGILLYNLSIPNDRCVRVIILPERVGEMLSTDALYGL